MKRTFDGPLGQEPDGWEDIVGVLAGMQRLPVLRCYGHGAKRVHVILVVPDWWTDQHDSEFEAAMARAFEWATWVPGASAQQVVCIAELAHLSEVTDDADLKLLVHRLQMVGASGWPTMLHTHLDSKAALDRIKQVAFTIGGDARAAVVGAATTQALAYLPAIVPLIDVVFRLVPSG